MISAARSVAVGKLRDTRSAIVQHNTFLIWHRFIYLKGAFLTEIDSQFEGIRLSMAYKDRPIYRR